MFPLFLIAIGIAVLIFGKRLSVLGAAVGALLGVALLRLLPGTTDSLLALLIPIVLAVIGFFAGGFAKGIVNIVLMVLAALAGAAIVFAFLDLFRVDRSLLDWLLAFIGAIIGVILVRRFNEWGMILLSGLIGALLVTRGLSTWLPVLQDFLGTLLVIVLAGVSIVYQGGLLNREKKATGDSTPRP